MMHMTFYWGTQVTILFDSWRTHSWLSYIVSLIAVFLFAVFHEYLVHLRERYKAYRRSKTAHTTTNSESHSTPLVSNKGSATGSKVLQSVLFGLNTALAYFLMLAVMSFNWGVFIVAVLGFFVGYLFFRSDADEVEAAELACGCA